MKNKFYYITIIMSFLFTGCKQNVSLIMQPKNKNIGNDYVNQMSEEYNNQFFDNNYYELEWGIAFPINYFNYDYKTTTLFLKQYGLEKSDFSIIDVSIEIEQLNYYQDFVEEKNMKIKRYNNTYKIDLINCMSDILKEEQDLLTFDKVEQIKINIMIQKNEKKTKLSFDFIPKIEKSNRLLDNLMSI